MVRLSLIHSYIPSNLCYVWCVVETQQMLVE